MSNVSLLHDALKEGTVRDVRSGGPGTDEVSAFEVYLSDGRILHVSSSDGTPLNVASHDPSVAHSLADAPDTCCGEHETCDDCPAVDLTLPQCDSCPHDSACAGGDCFFDGGAFDDGGPGQWVPTPEEIEEMRDELNEAIAYGDIEASVSDGRVTIYIENATFNFS